jgi:hypothetical protein
MKHTRALLATFLVLFTLLAVGCGGNTSSKTNPATSQNLIYPSGNWGMTFTDSNGNFFILSALYFQTGAVVTGINFSEVDNVAPGFQCIAQRDISISNGLDCEPRNRHSAFNPKKKQKVGRYPVRRPNATYT